ncbi:alpha/beta hydrolase [Streptomyces sp. ID38640]|uniref:alpha/beta hydrolase n=1 Tax=Streptomyces sp. ID38640 TaxID=1265399 RepID=UPI0037D9A181
MGNRRRKAGPPAVVVGHDWGAAIAWHTALLRPDIVRGVAGVSVPPMPRGPVPPMSDARERFGEDFYQVYFQQPQAAEAELAKDIPTTFRKVLAGTPTGEGSFLGRFAVPESLPGWLTEADIATFTGQFATTGFTGGLNWYRNLDRNWELTAAWQDAPIVPPALYVIGEHDFVRNVCPPGHAGKSRTRPRPARSSTYRTAATGHSKNVRRRSTRLFSTSSTACRGPGTAPHRLPYEPLLPDHSG